MLRYTIVNRPLVRVVIFSPRRYYSQTTNKKEDTNNDLLNTIPKITVCGLGGAGGNTVNTMIKKNFTGAEFIVANTDAQALSQSLCKKKIQIGKNITKGLGAGAKPHIGKQATEESMKQWYQRRVRELQTEQIISYRFHNEFSVCIQLVESRQGC
eukprot:TRINITY_DN15265_c0_g1_i1.p2 TRINITY_DN15265_c0_g1~~TRINITY_DN15265_c0_g1_i1.p2  ORF type:complete len:155 (-),score=32.57 TRINITY_DN15265_c0_g1_i1:151-615(-)